MIENDEKKEKDSPIDHLIRVKREAHVREDDWSRFDGDEDTECYKRCILFKHKSRKSRFLSTCKRRLPLYTTMTSCDFI